ncbi:MAG: DUF1501 domain-containing protein [Planctomycetaceae bacterium]|nr:DUF1501 domain-containing protein [Planctomycetaceae bacterium]MCB9951362.1 DUF1501 domain-containing protein [Planctomycetaceae bacterium]
MLRSSFDAAAQLHRRDILRVGGAGLLGLTFPKLLEASESQTIASAAAKAKSVIFLFQWGGPSHVDTFDLKPNAPDGYRSHYDSIATSVRGMRVVEHLPETAKVMHKIAQIRTVHHTMNNHNSAGYTALTGVEPAIDDQRLRESLDLFPAYGSVVDKVAPSDNGMPTFVSFPYTISDGSITPGQRASFLGKIHDPLFISNDPNLPDFNLPQLSLPQGISLDRLSERRELQKLINSQAKALDESAAAQGLNAYYERALGMLNSSQVREAFDLSQEPVEIREAYGRTTYGQSCLLARRLVESGVKFVTAYFARSIGGRSKTDGGWDTHGFDDTRMYEILPEWHLPQTDHTLPVLLNDLETRGLLDETLVLWVGEFGRTPKINKNISRDHWPKCYTALLAGGGTRGGAVYGTSDRHGAVPDVDPVTVGDLAATVYYALGISHETEIRDNLNRPLPIAKGRPVTEIFG